eukprot:scaffold92946_cov54-Phaeocystis_antarctica.AAC.3
MVRKKRATRQRGLKLRLRDLGKIWVSGFGPCALGAGRCKAAPYAIKETKGRTDPSPAASSATVEEPRARTESRCASEK